MIKELLNKADELIQKANELKELTNKQEENIILIPKEINFFKSGDIFCLNNKYGQSMWYDGKIFRISGIYYNVNQQFKLTKCNYEDIKVGEWFYANDDGLKYIKELQAYKLKLENGYMIFDDNHILHYAYRNKHCYKVELI